MIQAIFKSSNGIRNRNYAIGTEITLQKIKIIVKDMYHVVDKNVTLVIIDVFKGDVVVSTDYPLSVEELDRNIQIMENE